VDHFHADQEVIGAATSMLDRYLAAEPNLHAIEQPHFEQLIVCALSLAYKIHHSDAAGAIAKITPMTSSRMSSKDIARLEVHMSGRLGWSLNPSTAGILIHRFLSFLLLEDASMRAKILSQAKELALQALEGERVA